MRRLLPLLFTLLAACMAETVAPPPATAAGKPLAIALDCTSPVTEGQAIPCVASKSGGNGATIKAKWTAGTQSGLLEIGKAGPVRFTVPTTDDAIVQGQRALTIDLAVTSGSVRPTARASVQILDNDIAPPATQVCPDGSTIGATASCPAPAPTTKTCPDGSIITVSQDCPVIVTPPATTPGAGLPDIASNFDVDQWLTPYPPALADNDTLGAFRFLCNMGQLLRDDPIMYPGQPGKSHLHQFFGNLGADANSTYESLRKAGNTTCVNPLNRSAYWMPAMLDGRGNVVVPNYNNIYYKQDKQTAPTCNPATSEHYGIKKCFGIINGLRYIFGRASQGAPDQAGAGVAFLCVATGNKSEDMATALKGCPVGESFESQIGSPPCWNGQLDSPDHRSHLAYMSFGSWGYPKCPATHPYSIPVFSMITVYEIAATDDTSLWHFSSDEMVPGARPGSTFHADWIGAWDPKALAMWIDNCINRALSCKAGDLGNGFGMKQQLGWTWKANPRLVPIPAH